MRVFAYYAYFAIDCMKQFGSAIKYFEMDEDIIDYLNEPAISLGTEGYLALMTFNDQLSKSGWDTQIFSQTTLKVSSTSAKKKSHTITNEKGITLKMGMEAIWHLIDSTHSGTMLRPNPDNVKIVESSDTMIHLDIDFDIWKPYICDSDSESDSE